jgi:hypothetical protein
MNEFWDEIPENTGTLTIQFTRLVIPGWGRFANPSFCRSNVAYWALHGENLAPSIFALDSLRRIASAILGPVELETDNAYALARPVWNETCAVAWFNASLAGKSSIRLQAVTERCLR